MARAAESRYNTQLRQVAKQVDMVVRGLAQGSGDTDFRIVQALQRYAVMLEPWAQSVAAYMIAQVARRNEKAWGTSGIAISKALAAELAQAPTGLMYAQLQAQQVQLITSLPLQAAQQVQGITQSALLSGTRAADVAKQIMLVGNVTASRATLIARTEVARTASNLTQARAQYVGSEGYIWRTSSDGDVRPTHRKMNGKYIAWQAPPVTDKGLAPYHAGCGPNCRCFPDPVLP